MQAEIIEDFSTKNNFSLRPSTGKGLWVFFLLPVSIIFSSLKHPIIVSPTYKLAAIVSFTLLLNSLYIVRKHVKNERLAILNVWTIAIAVSTGSMFNIYLQKGWIFSIFSALFSTCVYLKTYKALLEELRESFTLGEAGLISQGITLFLYLTGLNIFTFGSTRVVKSNMQISTIIIQVGLLGIASLACFVHKFNIRSVRAFYTLTCLVLTTTIIIPLHIILNQSPVLWIFEQVFGDIQLLKLFIYWSCCIAVAALAVSNQIFYAQKASTSTRKIFHILAVLVYVPGLYCRCSFLYMASGVVLGVFLALEIIRLQCIPPLGRPLQDGYVVFRDEKDTGLLALTPIYLLVGVSLPIWLHPSPCDVTDSAQFTILPLLGGLLSIGIGDTAASYVGSKFGRFKWRNSAKTIEGTLACIFSQLGSLYFMYYIGFFSYLTSEHMARILVSVVVASLVEAKTSQIDNLVLPFVMYIILI